MEAKYREYTLEAATPADADIIGEDVRSQDKGEIAAFGFTDSAAAIRDSIAISPFCYVMKKAGRPVAVCGVAQRSFLGNSGQPWMIGTAALDEIGAQKALLRFSRIITGTMFTRFDLLENVVAADYAESIRWIKWMGFHVGTVAIPVGAEGKSFLRFWRQGGD